MRWLTLMLTGRGEHIHILRRNRISSAALTDSLASAKEYMTDYHNKGRGRAVCTRSRWPQSRLHGLDH
jgi:hypothetical protein